ncbi:PIN domain-containing protein [Blastococcus sp. Marseille-P5729]|uniref:PIN domain-containing protein n=1 Tax=Blastococcus sp. Marseille-P5729 TaxID=2086582 RepID=UPI000D0F892C|nr:PIN domain-containing protein [Blastococcus sp. Marseille-P5729]
MDDEDRIALFVDYENLALGARDHLGGGFDLKPVADALAERGRVVVRRAYADWSYFDDDRRMLTRNHVELIEIPQRMGAVRKNAADIKMAVDAIELAFERGYITTFAVLTGDSDFTPLVDKLRALNKRVIGFGVRQSTSALLPPACDEFLFYDDLEGVEPPGTRTSRSPGGGGSRQKNPAASPPAEPTNEALGSEPGGGPDDDVAIATDGSRADLAAFVAQSVGGLQRTSGGPVTASVLKRTLLRKDPTFSEASYGFRAFGELLAHLAEREVIELDQGPSRGDPEVTLPEAGERSVAFALLRETVAAHDGDGAPLSGLKDLMRQRDADFSEKTLGYGSFLQFCKAAQTAGLVELEREDDGYRLRAT